MILPHAVLCAMVASPAAASTGMDAPQTRAAPAPTQRPVPARLVADMAAPSSNPTPWDYTFEPWPPCSFG